MWSKLAKIHRVKERKSPSLSNQPNVYTFSPEGGVVWNVLGMGGGMGMGGGDGDGGGEHVGGGGGDGDGGGGSTLGAHTLPIFAEYLYDEIRIISCKRPTFLILKVLQFID